MRHPATLLHRTIATVIALAVVAGLLVAPTSASAAYPSFTFNGAGYGHGIGLSQYGAKGWAEHGKKGDWIATYYYPGSTIGSVTPRTLLVNLDADANYRNSSSTYNAGFTRTVWRIRSGYVGGKIKITGTRTGESAPSTTTGNDQTYTFEVAKSGTTVTGIRLKNASGTTVATYTGQVLVEPESTSQWLLQVTDASGPFDHTYVRYRGRMTLDVSTADTKNSSGTVTKPAGYIKLRNKVATSEYLKGVVPRESPSSWHIEALKAQAIVARSYSHVSSGDLYCTTWSQVYNGHSRGDRAAPTMHEADSTNYAVDQTSNMYVMYGGKVIQTFFHSSSGGHTANIEDVWLGTGEPSTTTPYRKGVDDPYCEGPYDPWTDPKTFDGLALAGKLASYVSGEPAGAGTSVHVKSIAIERVWPSGFARTVDITWANSSGTVVGTTRDVAGDTVRSALGLRSTKFFLNGQFTRIAYGSRFDTALSVSQKAYPTAGSAKAVVVVNGNDDKYADALTASALAGTAGGPVLLVQRDTVPSGVLDEIKRLGVTKAYVVGGTASVSDAVFAKVKGVVADTERLAGNDRYGRDRYGTAASVAMKIKALGGDGTHVMVASGENWPDAAVAAALAAGTKRPLILARKADLPTATARAIVDLGATKSAVFGGSAVISDATIKSLVSYTKETAPEKRFGLTGGRYTTAVEASKWAVSSFGYTLTKVYVSSGETFVDTVTGGALASKGKNPLLLTSKSTPAAATASYFSSNRTAIGDVVIIGGRAAITDECASTLASYAY